MAIRISLIVTVCVSCCAIAVGIVESRSRSQNIEPRIARVDPAAPEAGNDDEQMLLELRRRALEAENGGGEIGTGPDDGGLAMSIEELDQLTALPGKLGPLPQEPSYPADNAPTDQRIALGHKLYYDMRLSRDKSMSCASCHDPAKGWADGKKRAIGFGRKELGRHSPTVINTAYNTAQFWDGRADTLEQQAVGPIMAAGEMAMKSPKDVIEVLKSAPEYKGLFEAAYGSGPSMDNIGRAIAAFERTVITGPSRFDKYLDGDKTALTDSEKRGLILFITTASCTACHSGPNFTDNKFHSLGVRQEGPLSNDLGRFEVTKDIKDKHAFKTPGLRNVEQSAPYMHDGSLATLEEVVEFYNKGGERTDVRSDLIKPLNMTASQKDDLVAFLRSLTGSLPKIDAPKGEHFGK
jgi:cytochrome c peroxidase